MIKLYMQSFSECKRKGTGDNNEFNRFRLKRHLFEVDYKVLIVKSAFIKVRAHIFELSLIHI